MLVEKKMHILAPTPKDFASASIHSGRWKLNFFFFKVPHVDADACGAQTTL